MTATIATQTASPFVTISARSRRAGRILGGLLGAFLTLDAVTHIALIDPVRESFAELGLGTQYGPVIGVVMLACLALYAVPRTAVLGAILLTGYFGGAVAVNMVADKPVVSTVLFPIYVGIAVWAALWLRDTRVRELFAQLYR
ncbi:DoxX family protein [Aldersonia kunmingensis]|uniref:DoxX family protein n=1 Tax=Aldersonia kunmingensis TaxID=408066 RepID=UPI0008353451|nr:DoxX family protein [Aldersonia kunmingensis]